MSTYNKNRPQTIQALFNNIAARYDLANAILSFHLHKQWNQELVRYVQSHQTSHTLLDLCAGTGDIAFAYLREASAPCQAFLVDFSSEMLACAKQKETLSELSAHHIHYIQADVQHLPLPDQSVDCATMAYGIRNVHHPLQCLKEVYRVLKPGGCLGVLELTRPRNSLLNLGHQLYLKACLPLLGKWLTSDKEAYQYLRQSIRSFVPPKEIEGFFKEVGFQQTVCHFLTGGIATIVRGYK